MIRYKLRALMGRKAESENRAITVTEVAKESGIGRVTVSHMANRDDYVTSTDKLELLCAYFACRIEDLVEYVPDAASKKEASAAKKKAPGKKKLSPAGASRKNHAGGPGR